MLSMRLHISKSEYIVNNITPKVNNFIFGIWIHLIQYKNATVLDGGQKLFEFNTVSMEII